MRHESRINQAGSITRLCFLTMGFMAFPHGCFGPCGVAAGPLGFPYSFPESLTPEESRGRLCSYRDRSMSSRSWIESSTMIFRIRAPSPQFDEFEKTAPITVGNRHIADGGGQFNEWPDRPNYCRIGNFGGRPNVGQGRCRSPGQNRSAMGRSTVVGRLVAPNDRLVHQCYSRSRPTRDRWHLYGL